MIGRHRARQTERVLMHAVKTVTRSIVVPLQRSANACRHFHVAEFSKARPVDNADDKSAFHGLAKT